MYICGHKSCPCVVFTLDSRKWESEDFVAGEASKNTSWDAQLIGYNEHCDAIQYQFCLDTGVSL